MLKVNTWDGQSTTTEPSPSPEPTTTGIAPVASSPSKTGAELLTNSRLATYRRCPREHHYRYELGVVPRATAEALRFGTLMHHGLEAWWRAAPGERLVAALVALQSHATPEANPYELAAAEVLMAGYDTRWGAEPYEVIGVEQQFIAPLTNPATGARSRTWWCSGKLDVLVRHLGTGDNLLVEHKTSSSDIGAGSTYWARLRMDGQVSTYYRGAESLGVHVDGCIYDVIGKVGLRPLKATPAESRKYTRAGALYANQRERDETVEEYAERVRAEVSANPDAYYQRGTVVRLENEMALHDAEAWGTAKLIHESRLRGQAARNPDACERYGRLCSYFPVCSGEASLEDPSLYQQLEWIHPELQQAPPPKEEAP